jgi:hypothetical protein
LKLHFKRVSKTLLKQNLNSTTEWRVLNAIAFQKFYI